MRHLLRVSFVALVLLLLSTSAAAPPAQACMNCCGGFLYRDSWGTTCVLYESCLARDCEYCEVYPADENGRCGSGGRQPFQQY